MKTTYLTKQHQRALFYLECIDRVIKNILTSEDMQKDNQSWWKHPFLDKEKLAKTIAQKKEFSIWLMTRYEKVMDNICSHSYSREVTQTM